MGPAIANVKTNATTILNSVPTAGPTLSSPRPTTRTTTACADPFAFQLNQGITTSSDVQNGINAWSAAAAATLRAEINALYQVATALPASAPVRRAWSSGSATRPDTTRASASRWPTRSPRSWPRTSMSSPSRYTPLGRARRTGQATAIAGATGGQVFRRATPAGLDRDPVRTTNLPVTVTPVPTCDSGLSATYDAPSQTVTSGSDATFQETLTVSPTAPEGGTLNCTVDFLLNGNHETGSSRPSTSTCPTCRSRRQAVLV